MNSLIVLLIIFFVIGNNAAYATTDSLAVSVGVMSWYNRYVPISRLVGMDVPHGSEGFMNGPTIKAQYKDLYIGVMYLLSSNNYELVRTTIPYGKYETNVTSSATRTDIDVVIGYLLTPQLDVNAGYKGIFVSDAIAFTSSRGTFRPKHEEAYNLGTLGAGLHIPISTKATFLLNGNALLGTFDNTISTSGRIELISEDFRHSTAWGVSADTSVAYRMIENISGHIGLRWFFSKAGSDHSNLFGPTVGLDYLF